MSLDEARPALEKNLCASLGADGCLADIVPRTLASLAHPDAVAPWSSFGYRLYSSAAATATIRSLLNCIVPGCQNSYETVLTAIAQSDQASSTYCYLVGGQVRDVLKGVLSTDIDFNYSCSAKEVALVCVGREWPTKYKCIGPVTTPNYVMIGDEASDKYLEGFSITFNATKACYEMDFRQNMCLYCLANDVIIDKTGHGVDDIRSQALRLSCAAGESYEAWAAATITAGFKELRYIKFVLRASAKGAPLQTDPAELAFVVASLRTALRSNRDALRGFWFGYALDTQLKSAEGVAALRGWVCEHGGQVWWEQQWVPLVREVAGVAFVGGGRESDRGGGKASVFKGQLAGEGGRSSSGVTGLVEPQTRLQPRRIWWCGRTRTTERLKQIGSVTV
jgi:hypothetical protein